MNSSLCQKFVNSSHNAMINVNPWDVYAFITWPAGHRMDFHSHNHYQTIQVLDGCLEVDYGNGWEEIKRNSTHILPPGRAHRLRTQGGSRHFGIEFTVASDEMGLLNAIKKVFPIPTIQRMCFYKSWEDQLMKGNLLGLGTKLRLLHVLEDWTISLIEAGEADACDREATRLAELLKTWNRRSVSVADVASELHWSIRNTQRICNRRFGCGIMKLHEKMRMEEASRMLLNTGLSVGEIADQCGYTDIYVFSRAFTRAVGVPPSIFKHRIKNG